MALHDPLHEALLNEVEQQVDAECRAITEAAEREAEAIVAAAHARARTRVHDAIVAMRREGARQLRQAEAQRSMRERMREEARMAEMLKRAFPWLAAAVLQRWQAPDGRRRWIEAVAGSARERLVGGAWTVEHPGAWSAEDGRYFLSAVGGTNAEAIRFETCSDIKAGLRVRTTGAVLDATQEALLGNRPVVEALLLAELTRATAENAAPGRPA
ncbi:MAG: hypothetical protein F9K29_22250 [Hyphomicrobiaceae bacterium]|nr:MAG: hypothetical protein F9K29_22250 [Hyphomicrobiaceae bacterium]